MRFLIRVDASRHIGGGHVMRCLALARAAVKRGHQVIFACRPLEGHMIAALSGEFAVSELAAPKGYARRLHDPAHAHWLETPWQDDAAETITLVQAFAPDWLILDHYGLDQRWIEAVAAPRIMVIDDLADRPLSADLLLDQTRVTPAPYPMAVRRKLSGPHYALLRDEFASAKTSRPDTPRLLIAPGLMDSYDLASLAVDALAPLGLPMDLATGPNAPGLDAIRAKNLPTLTLHTPAQNMSELVQSATLAVAAGGMSSWERCAFGLPSVTISVADNQTHVCEGLAQTGAGIHVPGTPRPTAETLRAEMTALLENPQKLDKMAKAARALCDGQGTTRVLDILEARLRPLEHEDQQRLFNWRDKAHIRAASLTQDPLDPEKHAAWFHAALTRTDALFRIYCEGDRDLGFVGATQFKTIWTWSFYIGADDAPIGAGRRMLVSFLDALFAQTRAQVVNATVLPTNAASLRLHQTLGFTQNASSDTSQLSFTLSRDTWEQSRQP